MNVGTENGIWFSYFVRTDGRFDWEIYRGDVVIDQGVTSEGEFYHRFTATEHAASLPVQ